MLIGTQTSAVKIVDLENTCDMIEVMIMTGAQGQTVRT